MKDGLRILGRYVKVATNAAQLAIVVWRPTPMALT
jgi:hypothetical protein